MRSTLTSGTGSAATSGAGLAVRSGAGLAACALAITARDNLVNGQEVDLVQPYNSAHGGDLGPDSGWTPTLADLLQRLLRVPMGEVREGKGLVGKRRWPARTTWGGCDSWPPALAVRGDRPA